MKILVINCGSSSIKADLVDHDQQKKSLRMRAERLGTQQGLIRFHAETETIPCPTNSFDEAARICLREIHQRLKDNVPDAVGHRVVHGGEEFKTPVELTDDVEQKIETLAPMAPLHVPVNLKGIQFAKELWPEVPHFAVFDTAFHATLPRRARIYGLPYELTEKHGLLRYGFHGTSHQFVANRAAEFLGQELRDLRIITCHLGSGCSMTAVEYGRSVETSMGMTPLEGLVMGTRSGDMDPGMLLALGRAEDLDWDQLDKLLNKESGLKGLSGLSNDLRDIIENAATGNERCRMAIQVFAHRIRKYIGAYAAVMGGVDAIVFTGGIGENSPEIRHRACTRLGFLGALIDEDQNPYIKVNADNPVADFSLPQSRVRLLTIKTDEQQAIADQIHPLLQQKHRVNTLPNIPVAISARHVHLTQESVEALFGKGHQLTEYKPLSQPGQYAANETVTLVGPKNRIEEVRILGPVRSKNQVEISRTDEFILGIDAPIRESGKTENTPGIKLIGNQGELTLAEGLICAWRHIHMTPEDAEIFGVKDRDVVEVQMGEGERGLTFGNVLIRVSPKYKLEMHIDTDEGNAAEIVRGASGTLIAVGEKGHLKGRNI